MRPSNGLVVRAIVRPNSLLPKRLAEAEQQGCLEVFRFELNTAEALQHALSGCSALRLPPVHAHRSIWLAHVGAMLWCALTAQGLQRCWSTRVVLVSSLCAGRGDTRSTSWVDLGLEAPR